MNRKYIPVIAIILVTAVVIITNRQGTPLQSYDTSKDDLAKPHKTSKSMPEGFIYTDKSTGMSLFIPDGWQYVLKNGCATFAMRSCASWIQVCIEKYYPQICMVCAETEISRITGLGGSFVSFERYGNSSYISRYVIPSVSGYTDHIDTVMFDRDNIVTVSYVLDDTYYERLADIVDYSMSSIVWNRQNPIPESIRLEYSEFGNFEFGIPVNWENGYARNTFYALEAFTGSSYSVTVSQSNISYENTTQLDYISFASAGRKNFALSSYVNNGSVIYAEGTYYQSDERIIFRQCLLANGSFEYIITQECPAAGYDSAAQVFDDLMDVFRVF